MLPVYVSALDTTQMLCCMLTRPECGADLSDGVADANACCVYRAVTAAIEVGFIQSTLGNALQTAQVCGLTLVGV